MLVYDAPPFRQTPDPAAALVSEIGDDGRGLPAGRLDPSGTRLENLRERMTAASGTLEVESAAGSGTDVRCTVPLRPA